MSPRFRPGEPDKPRYAYVQTCIPPAMKSHDPEQQSTSRDAELIDVQAAVAGDTKRRQQQIVLVRHPWAFDATRSAVLRIAVETSIHSLRRPPYHPGRSADPRIRRSPGSGTAPACNRHPGNTARKGRSPRRDTPHSRRTVTQASPQSSVPAAHSQVPVDGSTHSAANRATDIAARGIRFRALADAGYRIRRHRHHARHRGTGFRRRGDTGNHRADRRGTVARHRGPGSHVAHLGTAERSGRRSLADGEIELRRPGERQDLLVAEIDAQIDPAPLGMPHQRVALPSSVSRKPLSIAPSSLISSESVPS